ncbi:SDR family NAD(P)-dependent oxidoreductase [Streptomyces griseochromogenes]|uniref:SDR family NAD(P)-dependent oxidoreductase n=1 Tax=Streptomyces griseochromogenes TaxID=68214 RepID=UPI0037968B2C
MVVSGCSTHSLAAAEAELGGPGQAVGVVADNADNADNAAPGTSDRLIASARGPFKGLDSALISVGGPPTGTTDAVDDDQWRASFESGFLGAVRLSRVVAAQLDEGGVIGFVLTTSVYEPIACFAISNAPRPALSGYANTLAGELGPRGVRVDGLVPAHIGTDRTLELQSITGDADRTAAFLLSPAAS